MISEQSQYERVCRPEFGEINAKLDRLDEAVRGNGKPGIKQRLEILEAIAVSRQRIMWIVLGAFASAAFSVVLQLVQIFARR